MNESRSLPDKFMLRLPEGMREQIKNSAAINNRSMNSEIIASLEEWLKRPSAEEQHAQALRHEKAMLEAEKNAVSQQLVDIIARIDHLQQVVERK
jgi:hypothetical protein